MRLLVTGGRTYAKRPNKSWDMPQSEFERLCLIAERQRDWVVGELHAAHQKEAITKIIVGDATGADTTAALWAGRHGIEHEVFRANWYRWGKKAGPIRNGQMLSEGQPTSFLAFPGGAGTIDMIQQARRQGFPGKIVIDGFTPWPPAGLDIGT